MSAALAGGDRSRGVFAIPLAGHEVAMTGAIAARSERGGMATTHRTHTCARRALRLGACVALVATALLIQPFERPAVAGASNLAAAATRSTKRRLLRLAGEAVLHASTPFAGSSATPASA